MQTDSRDKGLARSNHILFVDDEENVSVVMNMMLEGLGYEVTCHADGVSAYEAFSKHPEGYGLVICDQIMPGMSGLELADKVKGANPATPVILCTGYVPRDLEEEVRAKDISAVLQKPFAINKLANVVSSVLGGPNQATDEACA